MKTTRTVLSILLVAFATLAYSQKQGSVWVFGDRSGMNFNGKNPKVISTNLPLQGSWLDVESLNSKHNEGASSVCDSSGQLLFYSNGEKVWNKNGKVIADSLYGNFSATQSCIIVPLPGSNTIFYLFTMPAFQDTFKHGMCYSVIDACLNNGEGGVVSGMKNINLLDSTGEKLIAIKHANDRDYWIIAHQFWTNKFYAYLLGPSGGFSSISVSPVGRKHFDPLAPNSPNGAIGEMKASPDGKHIAVVNGNTSNNQYISDLFDFDPATGMVSNHIDLLLRETINGKTTEPYGCSFSPDGTKLYIGAFLDRSDGNKPALAQYDLLKSRPDSIRNSLEWITAENYDSVQTAMHEEFFPRSLQIAPNGKIYCSGNSKFLHEIRYPNKKGKDCGLRVMTENTFGRTYTMPNILTSYSYDNAMVNCTNVSVSEKNSMRVLVYPNPVIDNFTIQLEDSFTAYLFDMNGKLINQFTGTNVLDRDGIPSGLYILRIQTIKGISSQKVVFQ